MYKNIIMRKGEFFLFFRIIMHIGYIVISIMDLIYNFQKSKLYVNNIIMLRSK